jgi:hypothetical protein
LIKLATLLHPEMQYLPIILGIALMGSAATISLGAETVTHGLPLPQLINEPTNRIANPLDETNSPIIAVWQDDPGTWKTNRNYPYLRVAVWADGRVVFARDPNIWNQDLLIGQLSAQALATLQKDIRRTGVFELKGFCYLGPEFAVNCVMLSLGGSQQMLYWNEVENNLFDINYPKPHYLVFKKAWWDVNRLVLSALPSEATKLEARLNPPKTWYLKKMLQSE